MKKYNLRLFAVIMFTWGLLFPFTGCGRADTDEITGATWDEGLPEKPPMAVDGLEVTTGTLVPVIESSGIIEGIQEGVVVSRTQGIITEIYTELGDELEAGDPLLKVDDSVALLNFQQASEQMENARITLDARERLADGGGVSQTELLRVRSSYRGSQVLYETALKTLEDTTLRSPITGLLAWAASDLEAGNYLSPGQPVYRVADLSGIKIELSVGERQVGLITPGLNADIEISSSISGGILAGKVKAVAAASDFSTGSYAVIVEAEIPESSGIKAGMSARVRVFTRDPREGLVIPSSSVVNREGESYVFIEEAGRAVPVRVTADQTLGNRLIISEGLEPGAVLITTGLGSLKPGDPVKTRVRGKSGEET